MSLARRVIRRAWKKRKETQNGLSLSWATARMQMLFSVVEKAVKEVSGKIYSGRQCVLQGGFCVCLKISDCCLRILKSPHQEFTSRNLWSMFSRARAACNGNFPLGFCESLQHNPWRPGPACDLWCFSQYCQSGAARGWWEGADAVGAQEGVHPCFSSAPPTHCCWLPSM